MAQEMDDIWNACYEVVKQLEQEALLNSIEKVETERCKLAKRMKDYFKKALKDFNFNQDFESCVSEYADCAIGALFCGLGDRQWLEHADFLMVVHFAVLDSFPKNLYNRLDGQMFEEVISQAHDRAFDEQRWVHGRWGLVKDTVSGKGGIKKVQEAIDEARKYALQDNLATYFAGKLQKSQENTHEFLQNWIAETMKQLNTACHGDPDSILSQDQAVELFTKAAASTGLPMFMKNGPSMPPPTPATIKLMVSAAYSNYGTSSPFTRQRDGDWAMQNEKQNAKSRRSKGKGKINRMPHATEARSRSPHSHQARSGDSPTPPRRRLDRDSSEERHLAAPPDRVKKESPPPPVRPCVLPAYSRSRTNYGNGPPGPPPSMVKTEEAPPKWPGCQPKTEEAPPMRPEFLPGFSRNRAPGSYGSSLYAP